MYGVAVALAPVGNVDLKLLRIFMTVARSGGISLAQTELNLSQPTISIHIKNLETRLGLTLCQRGKSGFSLTDDGQRVYDATSALFNHLEDYRSVVAGQMQLTGELQIAIIDNQLTHPSFKFYEVIERFATLDHAVDITIHVAPPNRLERMVMRGEAHMAIGYFPRRLPQFYYEPLYSARMELYCGAKHPLFAKSPSNVSKKEVIAAKHAQRGYVSLDQAPSKHKHFTYSARSEMADGLAYLVLSGEYLSFLPSHLAEKWVSMGMMRSVLPEHYAYQSNYELIRRRAATRTPAEVKFYEYILESVQAN